MKLFDKNNKVMFQNMAGTFVIKGMSLIINLFTVKAYLHYFADQQVLGVWLSLFTILNWILTFDLGIGNGLRNILVKYIVAKDTRMQKRCISSGYMVIGIVSVILAVVGSLLIYLLNWNRMLNISADIISRKTLVVSIQILFIGVVLQFFLKLIVSVLYALQKTALGNMIVLLSNSLIFLFAVTMKAPDVSSGFILLSIIQTVTVNVPLLLVTLYVFCKPLKKARPHLRYFSKSFARNILKLGYMFLWIQITLLIINSTNEFLITNIYGPEYVVEYQVYFRVFFMFVSFFSIITNPIWSSVSAAYSEKRFVWIRKVYRMLNLLGVGVGILCFAIIPFFQFITNIVAGKNTIRVDNRYSLCFAVFSCIMIAIYSVSCIANGINDLKPQIIGNTIAAVLKIPLVYLLSKYIDSWICVVIVNIIIMIPCVFVQAVSLQKKLKKARPRKRYISGNVD